MSTFKIKIVCGFRKDQEFTIDANEAHKAYYLFEHPEKRGTFDSGLALKGSDIQRIEPDWHATMGYNKEYALVGEDWNEIHSKGYLAKMQSIMTTAKEVARIGNVQDFQEPLSVLMKGRYQSISERSGSQFAKQLLEGKK